MRWHRNSTTTNNSAAWVLQKVRRDVGIRRVGGSFAAGANKTEQWLWPGGPVEDRADSRCGQLNLHRPTTTGNIASASSIAKLIPVLPFVQVGGLGIHYGKWVVVIHDAPLPLVMQHQRHATSN